jgi:hypothetical protein
MGGTALRTFASAGVESLHDQCLLSTFARSRAAAVATKSSCSETRRSATIHCFADVVRRLARAAPRLEKGSGEGGIRTLGTLADTHDFQSCTFGHSVTSPRACTRASSARANPHLSGTGLAERVGVEPTVPLRIHLISNQAPSATRSSLRAEHGSLDPCCQRGFAVAGRDFGDL